MALVQHPEELRHRLLFCVAAVIVGTGVAFVFHDAILALLLRPLPARRQGPWRPSAADTVSR
jgi:Sec-independent protein secretion pathway component TatC